MRVRELKRKHGSAIVSVWPRVWGSSSGRGSTLAVGEEGRLKTVRRIGDRLSLTMDYDGRGHVGGLQWDQPPTGTDLEGVLRGQIGRTLRDVADVHIGTARRPRPRHIQPDSPHS